MSVSIPSDLVLDVVRAANPAVAAKAEELLQLAAGRKSEQAASTPEFAEKLASAEGVGMGDLRDLRARLAGPDDTDIENNEIPEAYRKFEAMVLGNFVQSMLPSDSEKLYGKGTAGEIWRGMMADQIGAVIAKGGGIGIAEHMVGQGYQDAVPAGKIAQDVTNRAANIINELQMTVLGDLTGSSANDENTGTSEA